MEVSSGSSKSKPIGKDSGSKKNQVLPPDAHRDVITVIPGSKALGQKCGNPLCYVRASETTLKACARCKAMRYCSRECQAANWKSHKEWCNNNVDHVKELAQADAAGFAFGLPPGVSLVELDQKLEKWVKFHNSLLMASTIHALRLPRDIKRARTYVLRVQVRYRTDNNGSSAKAFRVIDAFVDEIESTKKLGQVWIESMDQLARMRDESEACRRGTVAAIALECEPMALQIVPFGSLRDLSPLKIQERWKEILIRDVENGKKLTRFE